MNSHLARMTAILACALGGVPAHAAQARPAAAPVSMSPGLPIAEGAWVDAKTKCTSTQAAWVYNGASFGNATLYAHWGGKLDPRKRAESSC